MAVLLAHSVMNDANLTSLDSPVGWFNPVAREVPDNPASFPFRLFSREHSVLEEIPMRACVFVVVLLAANSVIGQQKDVQKMSIEALIAGLESDDGATR